MQEFTDDQIEEIALEMVRTRFRYLSIEMRTKLINPQYLQEQGLKNDPTTMEREDFIHVIDFLKNLGVPVPVYHDFHACDKRDRSRVVTVSAFHEGSARKKAATLLQVDGSYVVLLEEGA